MVPHIRFGYYPVSGWGTPQLGQDSVQVPLDVLLPGKGQGGYPGFVGSGIGHVML